MTGSPSAPGTREALDGVARRLLPEEDMQSVLQRVVDLVTHVVPSGAGAFITLVRNQRATTAANSGGLVSGLGGRPGRRPCGEARIGGHFVEIAGRRSEHRWPDHSPDPLQSGAVSAVAAPVPGVPWAACLNVYAPVAAALTDQHRLAVSEFAASAAVALTNMDALQAARDQATNLRVAMESRAVIEQAKGIVTERYKVPVDEAFRLLSEVSMRTNRKVRDLAEHLVHTGELSP